MAQLVSKIVDRLSKLSEKQQRWLVTGAFAFAQLLIWTVVFEFLWYGDRTITDTPIYYNYASRIIGGMFPYRDFAMEYPPVSMLLFLLPRILSGSSYSAFVFLFEAEMFAFSTGIIILLSMLAWRQRRSITRLAITLALYLFFVLALGVIVKARFDIVVAFIILASIFLYAIDRRLLAWVILGIGLMTKVVPVLIAPLFLIIHFRRRQWREMWLGPVLAMLAAAVIAAPFLAASWEGLASSFLYHAERPLQLESAWASPLLILSSFGNLDVHILNSYGSHNLVAPGARALALLSGPVTLALLTVCYLVFLRSSAEELPPDRRQEQLIRFSAVAIAIFMVGGKVLSPQFFIWLLPLAPLMLAARDWRPVLGLFTAALLLTQLEFPTHYWNLFMLEKKMVIVVALRNLTLAGLVLALLVGREKRTTEDVMLATEIAQLR